MSKFYFYLTDEEKSLIIKSLISKKNTLISAGKYTDGVDDVLLKYYILKRKKLRLSHCKTTAKAQPTDKNPLIVPFIFLIFELMFILSEQTILIATIEIPLPHDVL